MYGVLLVIAKLLSDAFAAFFGMLGLLSDFKDERKKITRTGKVALIGIVASFVLSGIITALEAKKSHDEEKAHREAEAATRKMYEQTEAKLQEELKGAYEQGSRKMMRPIQNPIEMELDYTIKRQVKPQEVSKLIPAVFQALFFKTPQDCSISEIGGDLATWHHDWKASASRSSDGSLRVTETLTLDIADNKGTVTSIDDLPGSMLAIVAGTEGTKDSDYVLERVEMVLAPGVEVGYEGNQFEVSRDDEHNNLVYCYTFPKRNF